jgi:hypothetical protein
MRISVENAGRIFCDMPWPTRCTDCPGSLAAPLRIAVSGAVTFAALQILARAALLLFLLMLLGASQADAEAGHLFDRLPPEVMAIVWPGAEELGPEEGKPPAIAGNMESAICKGRRFSLQNEFFAALAPRRRGRRQRRKVA